MVDKSHLFTLGEKMYRESIEFVRELVNNAYDADATEVLVRISEGKIIVEDNGAGMNEKGMEQFFTVGSEEKTIRSVSPRFGRRRIGQFGIGKFSALSLADQFIVESVKGKFKYSVIFDRVDWKKTDNWELPIRKERASALDREGTKIILNRLTKKISLTEAEKYLRQSVPLRAKKFAVYLNNKKITAKIITGKIIPIKARTMYGTIEGEIIIALNPRDIDEAGIECRVKQVLIKRDLFGLDKKYSQGLNRITGSVNGDFLPLISSRSDFIRDTKEYKLFSQIMKAELEKVLKDIKKQKDTKNIQKITKELQQVMKQVREALSLNPDFIPAGRAVTRLKKEGRRKVMAASAEINPPTKMDVKNPDEIEKKAEEVKEEKEKNASQKQKEKKEIKPLVMKRIRMKKLGISVGIVSLGDTAPEVKSQGNAVYINQDHPLYQKVYKKRDTLVLHLLRLITQEIVLMKKTRLSAADAYELQSKLLTDAVCNEEKK